VPDKQLSLAIGKGGQNARLAARLTGWRIDIKSTSMVEGGVPLAVEEVPKAEEVVLEEAVAAPAPETGAAVEPAVAAPEPVAPAAAEAAPPVEEVRPKAAPVPEVIPVDEVTAPVEAEPKVLTFEEILSQLEAIPERRGRRRYDDDEKQGIIAEPKSKKGKKVVPIDEEPGVKPKVKKGTKRRVTIEDEDFAVDEDLGGEEDFEEGE